LRYCKCRLFILGYGAPLWCVVKQTNKRTASHNRNCDCIILDNKNIVVIDSHFSHLFVYIRIQCSIVNKCWLSYIFHCLSTEFQQFRVKSTWIRSVLDCCDILVFYGVWVLPAGSRLIHFNSPVSSHIQMHQYSNVTWFVTKSLTRVWLFVTAHLALLAWDLPQRLFCLWLHLTCVFKDQRAHSWSHKPLAMLLALRSLAVTTHLQQDNAGWTLNCCIQKQV
jgi:hypothetical protein